MNLRLLRFIAQPSVFSAENPLGPLSCQESWLHTMAAHNAGKGVGQSEWESFLHCGPDYLVLLQMVQPANVALAQNAVTVFPETAAAWFWLGDLTVTRAPASAEQDYQEAVRLDPSFGLGWCRLGFSLEKNSQPEKAVQAFLNCCRLGDIGRNGCWGAGRLYEQIGDLSAAIAAYRLGTWPNGLRRADELEAKLRP